MSKSVNALLVFMVLVVAIVVIRIVVVLARMLAGVPSRERGNDMSLSRVFSHPLIHHDIAFH